MSARSLLLLCALVAAASAYWKPTPNTSWNWALSVQPSVILAANYSVAVVDLDLFALTAADIATFHKRGQRVICYFSAGSYENWRSDASQFPSAVLGKTLQGWANEKWLDIREITSTNSTLKTIMGARLDAAAAKGCDAVEPDNVDGYINDSGFSLTASDQIVYNTWLANAAHARGMSVGLKNDLDQIDDLVDVFDWALDEQCVEYSECDKLAPFIKQNKAVFGVEYKGTVPSICTAPNKLGFDWLKKNLELDGSYQACKTYTFVATPITGSGSGSSASPSPAASSSGGSGSTSSPSPNASTGNANQRNAAAPGASADASLPLQILGVLVAAAPFALSF